MNELRIHATLVATTVLLASGLLGGCGDDRDPTEARLYWVQPDTVVIGLGRVSDLKALTRDSVFIADRMAATIFAMSPPNGTYVGLGMADREPAEIELPAKLAVSSEFGLAAFDARTLRVDLYSLSGEHLRGFTPDFVPAMMSFSAEPVGFTFGIAEGETAGDRRPLVIRTDLQGSVTDTLLSSTHGPVSLRDAPARPGETSMSPSTTGMWVWTREDPSFAWHLSPRGTRRLPLAGADSTAVGLLADRARDLVWLVHEDSAAVRYRAYDASQALPADEEAAGDPPYLGERRTPPFFGPWTVHDGIVFGLRTVKGAPAVSAYDLNVEALSAAE